MKLPAFAIIALFATTLHLNPAVAASDDSWTDRIALSGDVRLRYEGIDEDGEEDRSRMRFRTRFGLKATVTDDVQFVFRLASGGDNPVSTNQSFDSGFSTKDIGIDLAYVNWKLNDSTNILAGKMKNPMFRAGGAPLIWDGDLNPEGFALQYESGIFSGTAGGFSVEERGSSDDSLLYVAQGALKFSVGDGGKLTVGAGYFAYTNTIGNTPFYNGRPRGNTVDLNGNYVFDYKNAELFAQFDSKLGSWPMQLFAHATQNREISAQDLGFAIGAKIGAGKEPGESQYSWTYQDIEADAVIGTFNDSDFGAGNTDSDGHILKASYVYSKNIVLAGTLFINNVDRFQGTEHDYSRIQLDVAFKFN